MGTHKGWRVFLDRGAWVGAAWDSSAVPKPRYRRKRWNTEGEAKAWAKAQHIAYEFKADSLSKVTTKSLVADYVGFLRDVRKRSPSHIRNVQRALDGLAGAVHDITDSRARALTEQWLAAIDVSARTKGQYLVAAKSMCKWAVQREMIPKNPLLIAETEKPAEYLKPQFTTAELRTIARAWRDPYHLRACLMAYAGLRSDEAAFLRWVDVDLESRVLTVSLSSGANVKRNKERLVSIQSELATILSALRPTDALGSIASREDTNDRRAFGKFLGRLGLAANGRSPHSLRHSYAVLQTATGTPSLTLKGLMGHSSMVTTSIYSQQATAYLHDVRDWRRGEFELLTGWAEDRTKRPSGDSEV